VEARDAGGRPNASPTGGRACAREVEASWRQDTPLSACPAGDRTLPIVMLIGGDPSVGAPFQSHAAWGNLTAWPAFLEAQRQTARVAQSGAPTAPTSPSSSIRSMRARPSIYPAPAASACWGEAPPLEVQDPPPLSGRSPRCARSGRGAHHGGEIFTLQHRTQIVPWRPARLPAIYDLKAFVVPEADGLWLALRGADPARRWLCRSDSARGEAGRPPRGAAHAFELVINLQTLRPWASPCLHGSSSRPMRSSAETRRLTPHGEICLAR